MSKQVRNIPENYQIFEQKVDNYLKFDGSNDSLYYSVPTVDTMIVNCKKGHVSSVKNMAKENNLKFKNLSHDDNYENRVKLYFE